QSARLRRRLPHRQLPHGHDPRPLLRLADRVVLGRGGTRDDTRAGAPRRHVPDRAQPTLRYHVFCSDDVVRVHAPAKINLRLKILAREVSGYHQLETIFCAVGLADSIEVARAGEGIELEVTGADLGEPRDNLVYRAARAFFDLARIA